MRKPPRLPLSSKQQLYTALKTARTKGRYQMALCLWLREEFQMNSDQVARALGMSGSGVRKIQARYRHKGEAIFKEPGKGGPHHRRLAKKVERAFLDRLVRMTLPANAIMNTRFVQEVYEKMVGHPVSYSVIYRLLKRHGWRPTGEVDMITPQWEAARMPFDGQSPADAKSAMSDAELEAAMKDYDPQ
jgi:transposase